MSKIYNGYKDLVGKTPLVRIENISKKYDVKATLLVKVEYFNPSGSVKDRAAFYMINKAIEEGKIKDNSVIIEPTSGNTGIGIAAYCAYLGYKTILVMPDTMSVERRKMLSAYGAQIVLTEGKAGMKASIAKAIELSKEYENAFIPSQFENQNNALAHFETTGVEIYDDTDGKVDIFVSGVGTGGTITGVGRYLKSKNKSIKIVAVEPLTSPFLSKAVAGPHKIQGIGAGFVPDLLDTEIYDEIITVSNEDAFKLGKEVAQTEGLLVGISSGAALFAGIELAKKQENANKTIVVLLPDSGDRYLSSPMFE